jgi:hypothetical protein
MGIKYSTGRGTRVRHSTALEWDDLKKKKKKYDPIKHATGESSSIRHATGTEFDYKALYEREGEAFDNKNREESKEGVRLWDGTIIRRESIRSRLRSKPEAEGEEYLELYQRIQGRALANRGKEKKDKKIEK